MHPPSCRPHRPPTALLLAVLLLATLLPAGTAAHAQPRHHDLDAARELQGRANAAYRSGDLDAFTDLLERALAANPASQATRYNLACGYARTGRHDEALELLAGLAAAGIDFGMAEDPDFAALRERPEFGAILGQLRAATAPVVASTPVHTVRQLGLVPEGIAADPATGRLFFGSMRTGEIYALAEDGSLSRFAEIRHRGAPLAALGLTVDAGRGLLWAVGAESFIAEGAGGAEDGTAADEAPAATGLFGFDLTSGALEHRHVLEAPGAGFNDVALAPDGSLYLTGHALSRVTPDGPEPRPVELPTPLTGTNGITLAPDGTTLFVSVYPVGLARVDLAGGTWRYLDEPAGTPLIGIDGLYWYRGDLVGIQNGLRPWRLLRMTLDEAGTAVTAVRSLEVGDGTVTPTTGALAGGEILYVGQGPAPQAPPSQFPARLAPLLGETVIRRAPLE